jgi:hypothetical protein
VSRQIHRYRFAPEVDLGQVEETLLLSVYAAEGVHGAAKVRLEAGYHLDEQARACVVDAGTAVGETVSQIFAGFLAREIGEDEFTVERIQAVEAKAAAPDQGVAGGTSRAQAPEGRGLRGRSR